MSDLHLVTGGAGFVGFKTACALASRGERVRVFDVIEPPPLPAGVEFVRGDVRDAGAIRRALEGVRRVYHNAALVPLTKAGRGYWEVNVEGTRNVMTASVEAGVESVVHLSSSAVYGVPGGCSLDEAAPHRPFDAYGRSKEAGEKEAEAARAKGLAVSIIRPRTIIGTERLGIFQILFEWIAEGRNIYVIGDGKNLFQFVHIDDLVSAIVLCAERRKSGSFNVGAERFGRLKDDLEALIRHAKSRSKVVGLPVRPAMAALGALDALRLSPLAPWHYMSYHKDYYFDIRRTMSELGWRPSYGNIEMLCESYDWFVTHERERRSVRGSAHRKPVAQRLLKALKWVS
jgi:nucleoside-diphosphate-sugar epimerase